MTQVAERPLTDPVPGAWIQLGDSGIPPVYVPYERVLRDEQDASTAHYVPGAHIKRLLSEGAMYTNGPLGGAPGQQAASDLAATEAALRAQLIQAEAERETMKRELEELRTKMAQDSGVPNAAKRSRQ